LNRTVEDWTECAQTYTSRLLDGTSITRSALTDTDIYIQTDRQK